MLFMKDEDKDGDKKKADKNDKGETAASQTTPEVVVLEGSDSGSK